MYTVMFDFLKKELRVVLVEEPPNQDEWSQRYDNCRMKELYFLVEHKNNPPTFATADEGWEYIVKEYPHLIPQ